MEYYYVTVMHCVSCKKQLNDGERMYNHGTCPKCGHRGENAVTIVDCVFTSAKIPTFKTRIKLWLGFK